MKKRRKKLVLSLIAVVLLLIVFLVLLSMRDNWQTISTTFKPSERTDVVVYGDKEYRYNNDLSNYLFLGIDTREPVEQYAVRGEAGQADAIYLLSYNRQEKTVQILAIPRDTMADIRVFSPDGTELGMNKGQINLQYAFGTGKRNSCELMKEAVSELLNVPIRGYCAVNMDAIPFATDAVGGVDVTIPDDTLVSLNSEFFKGNEVVITKDTAEQFVRYRDIEKGQSAISRMNRQKVFVEAYAKRAKSLMSDDPQIVAYIYESVEDYMVTSMSLDLFVEIAEATDISKTKIRDIPGKGVDGKEFDEYYINEEQLYELILEMFYEEL